MLVGKSDGIVSPMLLLLTSLYVKGIIRLYNTSTKNKHILAYFKQLQQLTENSGYEGLTGSVQVFQKSQVHLAY